MDDRLSALRDYRRARGLCIKCGKKWSHDHRCPEAIQLHALQELWEVCFNDAYPEDFSEESSEAEEAQLCSAISMAASGGTLLVNPIQFMGIIQGHPDQILIDSGSSHTFVSESLAVHLDGMSTLSYCCRWFSVALHIPLSTVNLDSAGL